MKDMVRRYGFLFGKLFITTFWFYIIYHHTLVLGFSFVTLVFLILFVGLLSAITFLGVGRVWPFFVIGVLFLLTFCSLVNFVYITVFDTFLDFGFGQNSYTLVSTFLEFYTSVPWFMYLVAIAFFCISSYVVFTDYAAALRMRSLYVPKKTQRIFPHIDVHRVGIAIVLSVIFGVSGLVYAGYLRVHPHSGWWDNLTYVRDYGISGHIFTSVYDTISEDRSTKLVYAKELESGQFATSGGSGESEGDTESDPSVTKKKVKRKPLTRFDYIRKHVQQILPNQYKTKIASVRSSTQAFPVFDRKPNIIIYQLESIPSWGMKNNLETMPYFSKLIEDNLHVGNFFANGCHTVDAEFSTLCSFYPHVKKPISAVGVENDYYCLPQLLSDAYEYNTAVFHANKPEFWDRDKLGPKWGFKDLFFLPHFPHHKVDDGDVLADAISYIEDSDNPVLAQIIGYSSHSPHTTWEMDYLEEVSGVSVSPYDGPLSDTLLESVEIETERDARIYLGFYELIDKTINNLFDTLKEKGLYENTIVVIVNDHRLYNFYGSPLEDFYNYNEMPFVLYVPGMEGKKLADVAGHIDIAPTILHAIEGDGYKPRNHFLGYSLFSKEHPNHTFSSCHDSSYLIHPEAVVVHNTKNNTHRGLYKSKDLTDGDVGIIANQMGTLNMLRNTMLERGLVRP